MFILAISLFKNENILTKLFQGKEENFIVYIALLFICIMVLLIVFNRSIYYNELVDRDYYATSFIDSLINGKVSLPEKPSQELIELKNPYDYSERKGIDYLWDVAYYKGNYYIYFGILPAILIFVPFKLIFGVNLTSVIVLVLFNVLLVFKLVQLLNILIKKYFKSISLGLLGILSFFLLFQSKILWVSARPEFYEMVIVVGTFFAVNGIYNCIKSNLFDDEKEIDYKLLFIGCLSLALSVACRPTLLFISLIILPNLWKLFIKAIQSYTINRKLLTRFILCCALPYIAVGILLMIYNYVRFENPFEFGASYQLTVTNNTNMFSFSFSRLFIGLYSFLFSIPQIIPIFPFVYSNDTLPFYQGVY